MGETWIIILKAIALILMVIGAGIVFGAAWFVKRYSLEDKVVMDEERASHLSPEVVGKLRKNQAIMKVKLIGLSVAAPGMALVLWLFK